MQKRQAAHLAESGASTVEGEVVDHSSESHLSLQNGLLFVPFGLSPRAGNVGKGGDVHSTPRRLTLDQD